MFEFVDGDGGTVVGVYFFEAVVGLLGSDFWVGVLEEIEEIDKRNLVSMTAKAHRVHDHLQVQIVPADVEPQLVENHLQLILKLTIIRPRFEVSSEYRVHINLVPRKPVLLLQLQAPPKKVHCVPRQVLPLNVEGHFLDVPN